MQRPDQGSVFGEQYTKGTWLRILMPISLLLLTQLFCYIHFTVFLSSIFTPFMVFLNTFSLLKMLNLAFFPYCNWRYTWPWIECRCSKLSLPVGVLFFYSAWAQYLWFGKAALKQLMQHSVIFYSHRGWSFVPAPAGATVFYTRVISFEESTFQSVLEALSFATPQKVTKDTGIAAAT